ncbi:MAG TPA: hypothetical protein ENL37_03155 [Desulfobacteraceae bacterium]|nr:hypothetical protein [Desulfobacteraceae bacterium]
MAANRSPYSFHEIVSVDAGHTVNIRDVLEPIPLKPSGRQPVTSKKVHEKDKKQSIHRDDKQLKLFPD